MLWVVLSASSAMVGVCTLGVNGVGGLSTGMG